jgi:large subunit ribosomal protein L10
MIKQEKEKVINELSDSLSKSTIVIATEYRGITAKEMVNLRRQLRALGIDYRVSKNTLAKFAAEKTGKGKLGEILTGPLALALGYDDVVKPAKALSDYIRTTGSALRIKGGILGDKMLTAQEIAALANIPSREILLGRLVSHLFSPLQSLHFLLSSPMRGLVYVLKAREEQLQKSGS